MLLNTIATACDLNECRHLYKTAGIIRANTPQSDGILPNISRIMDSILNGVSNLSDLPMFIRRTDRVRGHITLVCIHKGIPS